MPRKAPHPCNRCHGPAVETRYCAKCQTIIDANKKVQESEYQRNRKSPRERGYPDNWPARRKMFINKHPICQGEGSGGTGCHYASVLVHHIDKDPSNNHESNYAALCIICHSKLHVDDRWGKKKDKGRVLYVG